MSYPSVPRCEDVATDMSFGLGEKLSLSMTMPSELIVKREMIRVCNHMLSLCNLII